MDSQPDLAGSVEGSRQIDVSQFATVPAGVGEGVGVAAGGAAPPKQLGPYQIERLLGEGGQATVWLATQVSLQRPVALKVLSASMAADPHYTERFHAEAKMVARLQHKNVVGVYDSGFDAGFHWLAMELVEGVSVQAHLVEAGKIAEHRALEVIREVALAMQCASEAGILHRDIKPANVLITADGTAKLADLGLAKDRGVVTQHQTRTGIAMGTPFYMSPEVAVGKRDIDVRSDIYSLGVMVFEMLTGGFPLTGDTAVVTLMRHVQEDVPPVSSVEPRVTEATDLVVRVMTARDRDERYPDAATLVTDLDRVLKGQRPPYALKMQRRRAEAEGEESSGSHLAISGSLPRPARSAGWGAVPVALATIAGVVPFSIVAGILIGRSSPPPLPDVAATPPEENDRRLVDRLAGGGGVRSGETVGAALLDFGEARRAADRITEGLEDPSWRGALAEYRTLGVGGDLERLALMLDGELDGARVGVVLWRWATVDRLACDEDATDALDRYRLAIRRVHGSPRPVELSEDIGRLDELGDRLGSLFRQALRADLAVARSELESVREDFGGDLGDGVLEALRATMELREVIALVVRGADRPAASDGWPSVPAGLLQDPGALVGLLRAGLEKVEPLLTHLEGRAGRLAERIVARATADVAELEALGPIRIRGTEGGMAELAFHITPDASQWVVEDGLWFVGGEQSRTLPVTDVRFELRGVERFRRVTLELLYAEPRREQDGSPSFVGVWQTSYGPLRFEQTGDQLEGIYDDGESRIQGAIGSDGALRGRWIEGDGDAGRLTFRLGEAGRFEGTWGDSGKEETHKWIGVRLGPDPHGEIPDPPPKLESLRGATGAVLGVVLQSATGDALVSVVVDASGARMLAADASLAKELGRTRRSGSSKLTRGWPAQAQHAVTLDLIERDGALAVELDGRPVELEGGAWPARFAFHPAPFTGLREARLELAPR